MENQINLAEIQSQTRATMEKLLEIAKLRERQIVVIGCSTSEISGNKIGSATNPDIAGVMIKELMEPCKKAGIYLAIQCCEHLNRALVIEHECAQLYHLDEVNVRPVHKAGGALAEIAMNSFVEPVVVERIVADAGLDIGDTIIGMHLRSVVVPVRTEHHKIGCANVVMARTRKKYIGGPRAQYQD